jgi:hypothetical protein
MSTAHPTGPVCSACFKPATYDFDSGAELLCDDCALYRHTHYRGELDALLPVLERVVDALLSAGLSDKRIVSAVKRLLRTKHQEGRGYDFSTVDVGQGSCPENDSRFKRLAVVTPLIANPEENR